MPDSSPLTILSLASYEKGEAFLRECKRQGCHLLLLVPEKLAGASWPHDCLDEFFTLPTLTDRQSVLDFVSSLARTRSIDRIVPLDDYDVETAAALREHLRVPGMGDTTARYFRDKLAMRVQARDKGISVPAFVHTLNYDRIGEFIERVPPPWVLKPRSEAATVGISKVYGADDLWPALDALGDRHAYYLLERYVPGEVYHVDAVVYEREVLFAEVHKYGTPPLDVVHEGGIFTTRTLPLNDPEAHTLRTLHREVLAALGFVRGVSHTEFIKSREDGRFCFLESAARVGGAYIAELVEASTGLNLWAEWAKIEIAGGSAPYLLPPHRLGYAGLIISLARQEHPDTHAYDDPEIVWRLKRAHHAGLLVAASTHERVSELLDAYTARFYEDFFARQPAPDSPTT
jgi:hypothetical protein